MKKTIITKIIICALIFISVFCMGFLVGRIYPEKKISSNEIIDNNNQIDSGIELRVDIDNDGKNELLQIRDISMGDHLYTELSAYFEDGHTVEYRWDGHYFSSLMAGDLSGNGTPEILVIKNNIISNYGACETAILYYDKKSDNWKDISYEFYDKNGKLKFTLNGEYEPAPIDAKIVLIDDKIALELTFIEDSAAGTAKEYEAYLEKNTWTIKRERIKNLYE